MVTPAKPSIRSAAPRIVKEVVTHMSGAVKFLLYPPDGNRRLPIAGKTIDLLR